MASRRIDEAVAHLAPVAESAAEARRLVETTLREHQVDEDTVVASLLLTSEIVSNAVRHAGTDIDLRITVEHSRVRVEAEDGCEDPPVAEGPSTSATSGRGLHLVEEMATTWGCTSVPGGKIVWFEVET